MSEIVMINPANGEELGRKKSSTQKEVRDAYIRARKKFNEFRWRSVDERISELRKVKRYILENLENIVEELSKDTGRVKMETLLMDVYPVLDCINYYEKHAKKILKDRKVRNPISLMGKKSYVFYEALGVVLIISPWNFPFNLSMIPIISAILAGNTVVLKPSEHTTYTGMLIERIFKESGFEEGVVNVVYGKGSEIGDALIEGKPDKIFLTGSVETGKIIMEKASKYLIPVELELGGKDAMIIFDDVDLERTANAVVWGSLINSGQACVAIERVYVHKNIHDALVKKVVEKVKELRQGWNGDFDVGSMVTEEQIKRVEDHIRDAIEKGAKLLVGGKRKEGTLFFEPTVLVNVNHDMRIMKEETFGPVICIMKFDSEEEVIELANDTIYGLNASVWSKDIDRAIRVTRKLVCGGVAVNNVLTASANFALPFGGAKQSGIGRYHGPYGLYAFSNIKAVMIEKGKKKEMNWYPYSKDKYHLLLKTFKSLFSERLYEKIKGLPEMIRLMRKG